MQYSRAVNIDDLRKAAERRLPRVIYDFMAGGAEDERTLRRNIAAFDDYRFKPKMLTGVKPDPKVTLFGKTIDYPFMIGPTGLNGIYWHDADIHLASAAADASIGFALSTASNSSLEEIAENCSGMRWFQLYPFGGTDFTDHILERARLANYDALLVTVDSLVGGKRERDLHHGFSHEVSYNAETVIDGLTHPGWLFSTWLRYGVPRFENIAGFLPPGSTSRDQIDFTRSQRNPAFDWNDLKRVRDIWKGPMLLKGVMRGDDAKKAIDIGCDGVVISNHGGRQLDSSRATFDALPEVLRAVGRGVPILIDGGFRRGTDIVKALAFGAGAVLLGRATLYGVASGGKAGAAKAISILKEEVQKTMYLLGCASVEDITPDCLEPALPGVAMPELPVAAAKPARPGGSRSK
jgi:(S)-mandelate dehydrogenase